MPIPSTVRLATLALLVGGLACANNKTNDEVGAARDTSTAAVSGSDTTSQTQSGVVDSTGKSTLGPGATQTRPDQGQPVTAKGDTLNPSLDSNTTNAR
jgi:hypothetical protein